MTEREIDEVWDVLQKAAESWMDTGFESLTKTPELRPGWVEVTRCITNRLGIPEIQAFTGPVIRETDRYIAIEVAYEPLHYIKTDVQIRRNEADAAIDALWERRYSA